MSFSKGLLFLASYIFVGLVIAAIIVLFFPHQIPRLSQMLPESAESSRVAALDDTAAGAAPLSFAGAIRKAQPAVVSIQYRSDILPPEIDPRTGNSNPDAQPTIEFGYGSGVIVRPDGYIATNYHVVSKARFIFVELFDGRRASAEIIGMDMDTDLAVLKIDLDNAPFLPFSAGHAIEVGDLVFAIGNPYNLFKQSVTQGIISATGRSTRGAALVTDNVAQIENFIQTDAPMSPGSSGGALINSLGELIGITTLNIGAKISGQTAINFAIPAHQAEKVIDQLIETGKVSRGWLGVSGTDMRLVRVASLSGRYDQATLDKLDQIIASVPFGVGVMVTGMDTRGPAHRAGLQIDDVITHFNDELITSSGQLINAIVNTPPGKSAALKLIRAGKSIELKVTVDERPTANGDRSE